MAVTPDQTEEPRQTGRASLRQFVERPLFQNTVMVMICLNALILGAETLTGLREHHENFILLDRIFVSFFVLELAIRLMAYGTGYFRSTWNIVDFLIILGSVLAATSLFAAFRAFRILRLLRVVTAIPRMRVVVKALFDAIPGILSVAVVGLLIVYVFAVIASTLYGDTHPGLFGDVFISMYTLFQIMTLEGWRDIADAVSADHDFAWVFFLVFVLVGTFTMLNLFIAIVVRVVEEESDETEEVVKRETVMLLDEMAKLREQMTAIDAHIDRLEQNTTDRPNPPGASQ